MSSTTAPPKPVAAKKKTSLGVHLLAGGGAGLSEALACHWLDTINANATFEELEGERCKLSAALLVRLAPADVKVPMPVISGKPDWYHVQARGFIATGMHIVKKESPLGLYKGLGAVVTGIVPKMAIRFASFEMYKDILKNKETGKVSSPAIFIGRSFILTKVGYLAIGQWADKTIRHLALRTAGLGAGVTEAVMVVCPMEVVKIRLQAQVHSMTDPLDVPKYRNAAHALFVILREEGPKTLYRGVALTALRQSTNQAANFTAYTELKKALQAYQPQYPDGGLPAWQTSIIGLISGAMGPFTNAPIDTIKTRIQRATALAGENGWTRFTKVARQMFKEEGPSAFYKGITPRVARVAPGQAVVFTVYENIKRMIEKPSEEDAAYSE